MNRRGWGSGCRPTPQNNLPRGRPRRALRSASALAALALALLAAHGAAPGAVPAATPVTPLSVAPGVPGHGRAWELVSSGEPVSAPLFFAYGLSTSGDRLLYSTVGPLPDATEGEPFVGSAIAVRGPGGWVNRTIQTPLPKFDEEPYPLAIAPDLETSIWKNLLENEQEQGFFRRAADGTYTQVATGETFVSASADLEHLVFLSSKHLLPGDASRTSGTSMYEVVGSTLRLVDVDDSGSLLSECGSTVAAISPDLRRSVISRDGQRIFFETSPGCAGPQRVFMRSNGTTTTEISASQCDLPDCGPPAAAEFVGTTRLGDAAFFVTAERLTNDDSDSDPDLYRFDTAGGDLTLVSGLGGDSDQRAIVQPVRVSADGSHVYFAAERTADPPGSMPGRVYLADEDGLRPVPGSNSNNFMQISADGRYALYATEAAVAGEDLDFQIDAYLYDAELGTATLISTGPEGGNGPFDVDLESALFFAALRTFTSAVRDQPYRAMSDDARHVFFKTAEPLLPQDRNEVADVYEWVDGELGLVSAGVGDVESGLLTATADGETAFIATMDTLLPADRDGGESDWYAARIGGGFDEPSPPAACGISCSAAPRGGAARQLPASAGPVRGGIGIAELDAAARRRVVATGWIELLAEVPRAGRLSAAARARIERRRQTVAAASVKVRQPGTVRLRMRLTKGARQRLAQGRDLRLHLTVRLSGLASVHRSRVDLRAGA